VRAQHDGGERQVHPVFDKHLGVAGASDAGARMPQHQVPSKPSAGFVRSAKVVPASSGPTTAAKGITSSALSTRNVPYSKTRGWGHSAS
jgi:hypothetical protein